jgi:predicted dehydrogenase
MQKLRVGHIGWLSQDEAPNYTTVAWCDINEKRMADLAGKHPNIAMYTDYRKMIKEAKLDVAIVSTPNSIHAEQAVAFLEAGAHVFIEKPMGINRAECDRILAAQRRSGKNCAIDFEMRLSIFAKRLRELIAGGEYGALKRLEFIHHRGCWLEEGAGIWRTRPEQSGGLYFMEPIHEVDIFRYFGGEIVSAQSTASENVLRHYQFEDNVCSHFFFANGVLGTIITNHTHSASTPDPKMWPVLGHDGGLIVTLTNGSFHADIVNMRLLVNRFETYPQGTRGMRVVHDHIEDYSALPGGAFCHDIELMRREFIRRCAEGLPPVQDTLDAWKTHCVCLAAEQSLREDFRRVPVDYTLPPELR